MNLSNITKKICDQYNIKPIRSKGQNFLITEEIYDNIIKIADLNREVTVLEIGPGLGFLTERLAKKAKQVIAVELDKNLADILENRLKEQKITNVKVINDNILDMDPRKEFEIYKIVANLPYNITSVFLRKFLSGETSRRNVDPPEFAKQICSGSAVRMRALKQKSHMGCSSKPLREPGRISSAFGIASRLLVPPVMTLMLQKEVAERITAKPPKMSLLAISVQFYAQAKIIDYVNKDNFWPQPKVDSAIVKIKPKETKENKIDEKQFFRLIKIGFSARRKMLKNNISAGYQISQKQACDWLKTAGFSETIRAQELSVADWLKLFGDLGQIML